MRVNEPVTGREIDFPENEMIVSRTDLGGRITFVNDTFTKVSGYSEDELLGAPHNLVRHPDMPKEAFADLWSTIKAGLPWEGVVKNRCKNGDHYWVHANVTPQLENGEMIGYVSIRSRPSRAQIEQSEALYKRIREGTIGKLRIDKGELVNTSLIGKMRRAFSSVNARLNSIFAVLLAIILVIGAGSLIGMRLSTGAVETTYQDGAVLITQISNLNDIVRDDGFNLGVLQSELASGLPIEKRLSMLRKNAEKAQPQLDQVKASLKTEEEKELAAKFDSAHASFASEIVEPAIAAAERGDKPSLLAIIATKMPRAYNAVRLAGKELISIELRNAGTIYEDTAANFSFLAKAVPAILAVSLLLVVLSGVFLRQTIRGPLTRLQAYFSRISMGDFTFNIPAEPLREFTANIGMLRAMKAKLAYAILAQVEQDRKAHTDRRQALQDMADTVEREIGVAVERIATNTGAMTSDAEGMAASAVRVSGSSQGVAAAADQALANVQAVASATEQLASSIAEISSQLAHAGTITAEAVTEGNKAQDIIRLLSEEVGRIGEIAALINDIASQTNLLALNATIEAARAGEAGKGFAVVANEVKNLANQTARSTGEISQQIGKIKALTEDAVVAVSSTGATIIRVEEIASSITDAMGQQSSATQEISQNVVETSAAAREVAHLIAEVSRDAKNTGDLASGVQSLSGQVAESIYGLRQVLVRVIRTTTADANRRMFERIDLNVACEIKLDGTTYAARITNISEKGALVAGLPPAVPEGRGSLGVSGHVMEFEAHSAGSGQLQLTFSEKGGNGRALFERLTGRTVRVA